ncbi:MAG: sulfotransferase [Xenococcaceae cyanobacterium MO_234.B1]|nr:sulfotransferase [Xenococcaceae cyanobacterium MO_234.B1]
MSSLKNFLNSNRFIVLGGHKCGTSSLHAYLKQHPEIIMPRIKGQDILNRPSLTIEDYKNSYDTITTQKVFGEVSSVYLQSEKACLSIKKYFPEAKLLAILRNPVDRAFSHFNTLSDGKKSQLKFKNICQNPQQFKTNSILNIGLYYSNLKRYFENFNNQQIRILLFDLLVNNKRKFFSDFFEFIEVSQDFLPDTSFIVRKGGKQKELKKAIFSNPFLKATARTIIKPLTNQQQRYSLSKKFDNLFLTKNSLPDDLRSSLIDYYREDILRTQELLDINLSHWLKKP